MTAANRHPFGTSARPTCSFGRVRRNRALVPNGNSHSSQCTETYGTSTVDQFQVYSLPRVVSFHPKDTLEHGNPEMLNKLEEQVAPQVSFDLGANTVGMILLQLDL